MRLAWIAPWVTLAGCTFNVGGLPPLGDGAAVDATADVLLVPDAPGGDGASPDAASDLAGDDGPLTDLAGNDAPPPDLVEVELPPGPDLAGLEMALPPDLSAIDFTVPPGFDMAKPLPDLAGDMAGAIDLSLPVDFTVPIDLLVPPDLTVAGDMAVPIGNVTFSLDGRLAAIKARNAQPLLLDDGNTVAHFLFSEGVGTYGDSIKMRGTLNLRGVPNRAVPTTIPAPDMSGFSRVGVEFVPGAYLEAASKSFLDFTSGTFTIELWLRVPPGTVAAQCDPIVSKIETLNKGYLLCLTPEGKLKLQLGNGVATSSTGDRSIADGAWHYVTAVFDGDGLLFIDGAKVGLDSKLRGPNPTALNASLTVGGGLGGSSFRGSLAELVVHKRALGEMDHVMKYKAFLAPVSPAGALKELSYGHASPLCGVVADDPATGDRVGCYGTDQFALTLAGGELGGLSADSGVNHAWASEAFDQWGGTKPIADSATSPRADRTAEQWELAASSFTSLTTLLKGNTVATFSVWLKGALGGETVNVTVIDSAGKETKRCPVTLTAKWRRYACTQTFAMNPASIDVQLDTVGLAKASFAAWGAQLEPTSAATAAYTPNPATTKVAASRGAVLIQLDNPMMKYLTSAAGRVQLSFTGDAAMADDTYFLDANNAKDSKNRLLLSRGQGGVAQASVYDNAAVEAKAATGALSWSSSHLIDLTWNGAAALAPNVYARLGVDGAPVVVRATPFSTGAMLSVIYIGQAPNYSVRRASGVLHYFTLLDR